jgi:hypothetical protein
VTFGRVLTQLIAAVIALGTATLSRCAKAAVLIRRDGTKQRCRTPPQRFYAETFGGYQVATDSSRAAAHYSDACAAKCEFRPKAMTLVTAVILAFAIPLTETRERLKIADRALFSRTAAAFEKKIRRCMNNFYVPAS